MGFGFLGGESQRKDAGGWLGGLSEEDMGLDVDQKAERSAVLPILQAAG